MKRFLPFAIIIVVLVGAVAAGWAVLRSSREQGNTAATPTPDPAREVKGAEPAHMRGNPNAPVLLEEFGDFQCPACGTYHPELKKIEAEFGDKLKVIFRELPLLPMHEHALMAAQAAEAAGVQGKFWEMHDLLYDNQTKWVEQKDLVPVFVDYAKQIGINPDQFMKDLNGEKVAQRIFQDGKRAHSFGLKGTPSFFVNGKEARDEQWKPEGLRQMIRDAIAEAGK
jgi:NhaA family Na+:H+ antiporter